MRFLDLPKLKHVGSAGLSPALMAAGLALLGASMGIGVAGALAQSATSPGTATTAVTDPVASGGFGSGPGPTPALTGDVTPAFSNTPTPAFSSTPTPALSGTQTSPLGSTVDSTPIDGTPSGGVTGTTSADSDGSVNVSSNGTGSVAARRAATAQGVQSSLPNGGSGAIVNGSAGSSAQSGTSPLDAGNAFMRSGSSRPAVGDTRPDFVIVTDTAAPDSPAAAATQFTMVCNGGVSCTTPPAFVMNEK
jgi:hypothetical protein